MMKKAMISQPMRGKTTQEILETRNNAIEVLKEKGYDVVHTFFANDEWFNDFTLSSSGVVHIPLCFLAKSLESMSLCHAVYFCKGWEDTRGCVLEHETAKAYGLEIMYEE